MITLEKLLNELKSESLNEIVAGDGFERNAGGTNPGLGLLKQGSDKEKSEKKKKNKSDKHKSHKNK